jgi:uncharacterized protein (DUF433 family)
MIDWSGCPLVVKRAGYTGGKLALRDDPRVSPEIIVDNMDDGDPAEVVISEYDLKTSPEDARAIYNFAQRGKT